MEMIAGHTICAKTRGHTVNSNTGRAGREDCSGRKGTTRKKSRWRNKEKGGNESKYKKEQIDNNEAHGT